LKVAFVGERSVIINTAYVAADDGLTPSPGTPPVTASDNAGVPVTPTAVTLILFKSVWQADEAEGVRISWETGSEFNTFGFSLYRSATGRREDAVRVTPELIASESVNTGGASYVFDDTTAEAGQTYTYWLLEVETTGKSNEYGPVDTNGLEVHGPRSLRIFLPVLMR